MRAVDAEPHDQEDGEVGGISEGVVLDHDAGAGLDVHGIIFSVVSGEGERVCRDARMSAARGYGSVMGRLKGSRARLIAGVAVTLELEVINAYIAQYGVTANGLPPVTALLARAGPVPR